MPSSNVPVLVPGAEFFEFLGAQLKAHGRLPAVDEVGRLARGGGLQLVQAEDHHIADHAGMAAFGSLDPFHRP